MTRPTIDATMLKKVRDHILNTEHSGHRLFCRAICGPDGATWIEPAKCDCTQREALAILNEVIEVTS